MEGLNRAFKDEDTRRSITPLRRDDARARWSRYFDRYDEHRPHEALNGPTPNEVYHGRAPANEAPRLEPRARWPEQRAHRARGPSRQRRSLARRSDSSSW
ncbi:MAG: transposase [Deltaproteobacteria bacterium]|nr:transposase [Deltaproteobacteria bacterium]